jgi:opacity protein-like surface antigen
VRKLIVGLSSAALLMSWAPAATAAAPLRVSVPVHAEFEDDGLSEECGFQVLVTIDGTIDAALWTRGSGAAAEADHQVLRWTFTAPATGTSFSYVNNLTARFDYPDGAVVGGRATVTLTGTEQHVAGSPAAAGRLVFDSTIDHLGAEGFPVAFLGEPRIVTGSHPEGGDPCAALG